MTKKELLEMIKNIGDDEQLNFVYQRYGYEGFPYDSTEEIYKVLGEKVKRVTREYGITRLVNDD